MAFDINVAFNVETKELVNARNALQSLVQVSKDINSSQDKAAKSAEALVKANDKVAESAKSASKALEDSAKSAEKTEKSAKSLAGEGDAAANRLAKLKDQLSFLRDDLNLSEVGFTKSQAGVLAWAKSVNASSSTIKEFASTFDKLNKIAGVNPFDQSAKGLSALNSELRELKQVQTLAAESVGLTTRQVQMLSRDLEGVRQQNEAFGRSADEGVQKHRAAFIEAANAVNAYKDQVKIAQRESENLFKAEQELARNRKLVNDELARSWGSSVGKKSQALSDLADQYAEEERMAAAHQAKLQKINSTAGNDAAAEYYRRQAAASKIASDAIEELERDTRKLIITNELLDRGFTSSSANALFRYRESLERTGVSAMELKQKLYLLEQDLMKRQNTSPFAKMREDIKQVTQQTNHLARAISVQLGDVAISLAGGQNPFVVLMQQGDQIRGAVQQAVDAGQKIDQAMKGAVLSMISSFKLVGQVMTEFVKDGLRSLNSALDVVGTSYQKLNQINKQYESGIVSALRHTRLLAAQKLILRGAVITLAGAVGGVAAVIGGILIKAYLDASKENFNLTKALSLTGASLGISSDRAITLAKSMTEMGVSATNGKKILTEMATIGGFTAEQFSQISDAVVSFSQATGEEIKEVVKKFSEVNKDPVKALSDLQIAQGNVSEEVIKNVKELVSQNKTVNASREAMTEFARATKEVAEEIKEGMPWYKELGSWLNRAAQSAWDFAKGLWDSGDAAKNLKEVNDQLKNFKETGSTPWWVIGPVMKDDWETGLLKQQAEYQAKVDEQDKKAAERRQKSQAEAGRRAAQSLFDGYKKTVENSEKKQISKSDFISQHIEEYKNKLGEATASEQELAVVRKAAAIEWENANKSSAKRAKETYSVNRDNELQETKRFYDAQLKQLKDFESKQSQINKAGYESKAISYGQYVAREIELVASSQKQQLEVIQKSEDAYRKNIEARKKAQESAASAAIKSGANSSKINAKLAQELKNLSNESATAEENFKGMREALENAANAKYAEFFKELSKALFESNEELKKFSKSVEDNARRRKEDLALEQRLLNVYGAEAEALKASTSTMRGYESAITSANKALEEAVKHRQDLEKELSTVVGVEAYNRLSEQVREAVKVEEQLRKNAAETASLAQIDANQAATDAMQAYNLKVYKEMRDSLSESIYDAIFEGGKSGGQALKNVLKNMFKNYVINVILNPMIGQIMGGVLGQGASSGAGANLIGNLLGSASNLSSIYKTISSGFNVASSLGNSIVSSEILSKYGSDVVREMAGQFGAGMMNTSSLSGFSQALSSSGAQMAGAIAGSVLNGFSGYSISKLLSGGYEVNKYVNKIAGVASAIPGIGPIAGVVGGAVNRVFGRKLKDSGIEGTFGGEQGFVGNTFEYHKGGFLRKSKTKRGTLDESTRSYFADQFTGTQSAIKAMGDALGLVTGAVDGATYSIKVSLKGLSEEDASKKIQEEFDRIAENMAELVLVTNEYSLADENRIETLTRLSSSLMTFNESLELLGLSAYDASLKSADAAYQIIAAFGGLEGYTQTIQSFYQNFYSEQERMDRLSQQLRDTLSSLDLSIDPAMGDKAKEQYRQAVESALSAGQVELATQLLAMSEMFATAADYAQQSLPDIAEIQARIDEITNQQHALWADLAEAQGDFAIAAQRRYWIETAGMTLAEQAAYDYNEAIKAQIEAAKEATEALHKYAQRSADDTKTALSALDTAGEVLDSISGALGGSKNGYSLLKEQRLWAALVEADYKTQIDLAKQLSDSVLSRYQVEQQASQKQMDFARSLRSFVDSLLVGNLSPLTTAQKLAEATKQYKETLSKAQTGDEKALNALQGVSSTYLDLARQYYASSENYTAIFEDVTSSLGALSISSQSQAEQQLNIASDSLKQLQLLQGLLEQGYNVAQTDYLYSSGVMTKQLTALSSLDGGVAEIISILSSFPKDSGIPLGNSVIGGVAQKYTDLMAEVGVDSSHSGVVDLIKNGSKEGLMQAYHISAGQLQTEDQLKKLFEIYRAVMQYRDFDGSHANGLDYVPFNGYVAELHKGERVLTASENRSYGTHSSNLNSSLVTEVKLLREEINMLRKENREDTDAVVTVTAKANELNAKTIVEGVNEARSRENYSNNLGAKLR